jgi:hypothetical protein
VASIGINYIRHTLVTAAPSVATQRIYTMLITKVSSFTKKTHTLDIDVTNEQIAMWKGGMFIQEAMPHLTPDEREFIMTGITAEEWAKEYGSDYVEANVDAVYYEQYVLDAEGHL